MHSQAKQQRAKRTKPIQSVDDVTWEIVYGEESEESQCALDALNKIIYDYAVVKNFFKKEQAALEKSKQTNIANTFAASTFSPPALV